MLVASVGLLVRQKTVHYRNRSMMTPKCYFITRTRIWATVMLVGSQIYFLGKESSALGPRYN